MRVSRVASVHDDMCYETKSRTVGMEMQGEYHVTSYFNTPSHLLPVDQGTKEIPLRLREAFGTDICRILVAVNV